MELRTKSVEFRLPLRVSLLVTCTCVVLQRVQGASPVAVQIQSEGPALAIGLQESRSDRLVTITGHRVQDLVAEFSNAVDTRKGRLEKARN
jgi:hypothetical protein